MDFGLAGVEIKDTSVVASLSALELSPDELATELTQRGLAISKIESIEVPDVDWSEHWKQHFAPLQFGDL